MSTRYATALSHIILAGTGFYCFLRVKNNPLIFPKCSLGAIVVNSLIGIWRWGNPSYGRDADRLYKLTSLMQDLLALPCILTTLWLQYDYIREIAYAFTVSSVLPLISYFFDKSRISTDILNTLIGFNCVTLCILSFIQQNYFGVAASLSYAFSHFIIRNDDETYFSVTSQDLYNYAMCFFAFFGLKAVLD